MGDTNQPSGRFLVRLEPALHAELRAAAARAGVSLNELCARRLAVPGDGGGPGAEAVERVRRQVGGELLGVVAFGSWAREEAMSRSDIDLLVVLAPAMPVVRDLYRPWDAQPLRWDGRPVEPHFVHLPAAGDRISGLWAEAAVDGVVLFDRELAVSLRLVEIRRRIVAGEIARRRSHGHPYWVEAA